MPTFGLRKAFKAWVLSGFNNWKDENMALGCPRLDSKGQYISRFRGDCENVHWDRSWKEVLQLRARPVGKRFFGFDERSPVLELYLSCQFCCVFARLYNPLILGSGGSVTALEWAPVYRPRIGLNKVSSCFRVFPVD